MGWNLYCVMSKEYFLINVSQFYICMQHHSYQGSASSKQLLLLFCSFICSAILSLLPCSITNLQMELSVVCGERDELAQELKRTPELIERTLADLKEQCEPPLQPPAPYHTTLSVGYRCWQCMCLSIPFVHPPSSDESTLRRQQLALEQSCVEVRQALAGREEAEQRLQQIQTQLDESKVDLEKLRSELLSQQEHSERGEPRG